VFDTARDINQVDPRIAFQYKDAVTQQVANPFYNILSVEKFPRTAALSEDRQHLVADEALSAVWQHQRDRRSARRGHEVPVFADELQKNFSKGYSLIAGTTIISRRISGSTTVGHY